MTVCGVRAGSNSKELIVVLNLDQVQEFYALGNRWRMEMPRGAVYYSIPGTRTTLISSYLLDHYITESKRPKVPKGD